MGDYRAAPAPGLPGELGPEIGEAGKSEDLFVFNVQHVTLKRGERMVLPIAEFTLPYKDVFTLDLPFGPPPEVRANLNNEQQRELARLFNAPKVMHKIRLTNNSKYPLTTAPALMSLPIPLPGHAVSLAMTVRSLAPRLTSASMRRCGEPTPMKPPIKSFAPSGISAAPASALIATFISNPPVPAAPRRARCRQHRQ